MLPEHQKSLGYRHSIGPAIAWIVVIAGLTVALSPPATRAAIPYSISIVDTGSESAYGQSHSGMYPTMRIWVDTVAGAHLFASSFEFLIAHDLTGLSFISAQPGDGFPAGWEYFSYRTYGPDSTCSGCPAEAVRLIGIADASNKAGSPATGDELAGSLVELTYYTGTDCYLNLECFHMDFYSAACGDNVVRSSAGDSLFIPLSGTTQGPHYDTDSCLGQLSTESAVEPAIMFTGGAMCIVDPPDDRGDLNLNCIENEIGDAVLYGNYFIYGPSVWDPTWREVQVFASDINNDGKTLTIADFVYLIRAIAGQADLYPLDGQNPKAARGQSSEVVFQTIRVNDELHVQTNAIVGIAGIHLLYHYSGVKPGAPVASLPPGIVMGSSARDGELRIAIYPDLQDPGTGYLPGTNDILTIPITGRGELELVEAQFSDPSGQVLEAKLSSAGVPDRFTLNQNYPNPFNAETVIPYSLTEDAWVTIEIVDILGRTLARPVDEFQAAGAHECAWRGIDADGQAVASGMYFYRLAVGDRVLTKKMVLLK